MRTALYIRVSTEEQGSKGYSLQDQKERLEAYVRHTKDYLENRYEIVGVFEDVSSGGDLNRPAYIKMMDEYVKSRKVDCVIITKIDRLSRNLQHLLKTFETLQKNNVSLYSLQENIDFRGSIGGLIFQIFGALAEFERNLIKDRTMSGKRASTMSGNYTRSDIPYGYKKVLNSYNKGSVLEIIDEEAEVVRWVYNSILEGKSSATIVKEMNKKKVSRGAMIDEKHNKYTPRKGEWTEDIIDKILKNTVYAGWYRGSSMSTEASTEEAYEGKTPIIVGETIFTMVREERSKRGGGASDGHMYLLKGLLKDYTLDTKNTFIGKKRHDGKRSYRRDKVGNGVLKKMENATFEIPCDKIDSYVWSEVKRNLERTDEFLQSFLYDESDVSKKLEKLYKREKELEIAIEKSKEHENTIEMHMLNGLYSEEKRTKLIMNFENKRVKDEEELDNVMKEIALWIDKQQLEYLKQKPLSDYTDSLETLTVGQKQMLIRLFVDRVECYRTQKLNKEGEPRTVGYEFIVVLRFQPKYNIYNTERVALDNAVSTSKSDTSRDVKGKAGGGDGSRTRVQR